MARRFKFALGEFYHIYNRGTDKRKIFLCERDYERFLALLFLSNSNNRVDLNQMKKEWSLERVLEFPKENPYVAIGAYCLMPNHFHILLKELVDGGVSRFMKKLSNGFTMYMNQRLHRTGALFEGRFKAEHVNEDRYLKYLYAYIHLNPIGIIDKGWKDKKITDLSKAKEFLMDYRYSSLPSYIQNREVEPQEEILDRGAFPKYFETSAKFKDMIEEWINFEKA